MGVLCKNPTDLALAKIREHGNIDGVVSLGDGIIPAEELGPVSLINFLNPHVTSLPPEAMSRVMSIISLYMSATVRCVANSVSTYLFCTHLTAFAVQNTLGRETARNHESEEGRHRSYQYFRFNPLLQDQIPTSEDTSLDTLINVIFQTISYVVKNDGSELSHLLSYINNHHK